LVLACDRIFDGSAVFIALALRVHSFGCVGGGARFLRMGRGTLRLLRSTFPAPLVLACDRIFDGSAVFIPLALRVHSFGWVGVARGSFAWAGCFAPASIASRPALSLHSS